MLRLFFLFFLFVIPFIAQPFDIELFSKSAILINAENGKVLLEKKAKEPMYPASITKIATAIYVLEKQKDLSQRTVASENALLTVSPEEKEGSYPPHVLESDGSNFEICTGEILSIKDLLYGLMLASGNDAANVLAEAVDGTISNFMKNLNSFLREKGIKSTYFCSPHGLHHQEHITTAEDMAKLTQLALRNLVFRKLVAATTYVRPSTNKQGRKEIEQLNQLLVRGKNYYPYAIGVKTGYHCHAQNTLVAAAEKGDRSLIAVLLGCEKREHRYIDAVSLFERAFAEEKVERKIFDRGKEFTVKIKEGGSVQAALPDDLSIDFYPSEEEEVKAFLHAAKLTLPLKKGDKVGEIWVTSLEGKVITKGDLVAKYDVGQWWLYNLIQFFKNLF